MEYISIIFTHWSMNEERAKLSLFSLYSLIASVKNLPVEIIVIDNGGTPSLYKVFNKLVKEEKISCYIRNSHNMSFGYARNQGLAMPVGDFVCVVDNDLKYEKGWLERCVKFLEDHPDKKIYATPLQYPTAGMVERYSQGELDGWALNMRAGSNCWVMRSKYFFEVGFFLNHRIAGSIWTDEAVRKGYLAAVDPVKLVKDLGLRKGYNLGVANPIKKKLLNGKEVYFNRDEYQISHK